MTFKTLFRILWPASRWTIRHFFSILFVLLYQFFSLRSFYYISKFDSNLIFSCPGSSIPDLGQWVTDWVTQCHFWILIQRVTFDTWDPSYISSDWCPDKNKKIKKDNWQFDRKTKRQKDRSTKRWSDKKEKRFFWVHFSVLCVFIFLPKHGQEDISLIFRPQKLQAGPGYRNGWKV